MGYLVWLLAIVSPSLAVNIITTSYWNFADPSKAKDVCMNNPNFFNYTVIGPTGFMVDTDYSSECIGDNCTYSGTDTCNYWTIREDDKISYMNFTRSYQNPKDIKGWVTRPFCDAAPRTQKVYESGSCVVINPLFGINKYSIGLDEKSCTMKEVTYKNAECTQPSNGFPVQYKFDLNKCEVFGFTPGVGVDEGGTLFAAKVTKIAEDRYQVQVYDDPYCIFPSIDPDQPGPQAMNIGECSSDDDDEDNPFRTWTKIVSLECGQTSQFAAQKKSFRSTSFTRLTKKMLRARRKINQWV